MLLYTIWVLLRLCYSLCIRSRLTIDVIILLLLHRIRCGTMFASNRVFVSVYHALQCNDLSLYDFNNCYLVFKT